MKICLVWTETFLVDGLTGMMKLPVTFRNNVNTPENKTAAQKGESSVSPTKDLLHR